VLADDQHGSTPEFIQMLGYAYGRPARIFPFPVSLLRAGLDRFDSSDALLGSLEIDTTKARLTGWQPRLSLADGLLMAAEREQSGQNSR
jgi:UDP-glucose 4-epimerase